MRVLVVASHSGGHIFPAIAFCQGLKDKNSSVEINFISTYGEIENKLLNKNLGFNTIFFKRKKLTIINSYNLILLFFKANVLIRKLKPDLIVGFGGYLSIPFIICAHFQKIPNFIHEQNVKIGLANRFLAKFCDKVIFTFPGTQIGDKLKNKSLTLGVPLRKELRSIDKTEARLYFNLDRDRFTLLVVGGSQGSSKINKEILNVLKDDSFYDAQVIHITGSFDYEEVAEQYRRTNIKYKVFSFLENMEYAYSACDMVICRAGASTIAEIATLKIPSILIPYPYAKHHQLYNARFLVDKNAAILIEDKLCCETTLKEKILDLKNNPGKLKKISQALNEIDMLDSRRKMSELVFQLAQ